MNFISNHFVSISLLLCIVVLLFHIRDLRHKLRRLSAIVRRSTFRNVRSCRNWKTNRRPNSARRKVSLYVSVS